MTTQKIRLTRKLPGRGDATLKVSTGVWEGDPHVRIVGYGEDGMILSDNPRLILHTDAVPDLIAALRWAIAGPLERQLIDKEREQ